MNLEEIQDILAEHENRLNYLEASQPITPKIREPAPIYKDMQWTNWQWDYVQQLHGLVLHLQKQLLEHLNSSKGKSRGRY